MSDFEPSEPIRSLAMMAETAEVEPESTDIRKERESELEDKDIKETEEKRTEPASSPGLKPEKVQTAKEEQKVPKPSKFKELWGKIGLDIGTFMMMIK